MRQNGKNRFGEGFSRFCAAVILALLCLFMAYLFVSSLLSTSDISTGSGFGEVLRFQKDSVLLNLAVLFGSLALLYLFYRLCDGISLKFLTILLLAWTLLAGIAFICSVKLNQSQDSYVVTFWAMQAAKGDTHYYHDYYAAFPYQFGFTLYEELFFRFLFRFVPNIPEGFACMALQGINLLLLCGIELLLIRFVGVLFHSPKGQKMTALLLLLSLHGILTSTYLYGIIPGFAFSLLAVLLFLRHQKRGTWISGILCGVFLAVAVILKLNYMIVLVALGIIWILCLLRRRSLKSAVCFLLCVAMVLTAKDLPQKYYERRMQTDLGKGVPLVGWLALGMNEGQTCSGWYDSKYTAGTYADVGRDRDAAAAIAGEAVKERLQFFRENPKAAAAFFNRKFLSQWNEPSYESIWTNNVREHFSEPGRLYQLVCRSGEAALKSLMNFYQQLILFGLLTALILLWKKREILECVFPLILLGGVFYHILFEAKSQYSLTYFLLMIPLAAYGLTALFSGLERKN